MLLYYNIILCTISCDIDTLYELHSTVGIAPTRNFGLFKQI